MTLTKRGVRKQAMHENERALHEEYLMGVDPPAKPAKTLAQVIADIYGNRNREYNTTILVRRLQQIARKVTEKGCDEFAQWIPAGDISAFAACLPDAIESRREVTMALLLHPDFQHLLENYPIEKPYFTVAENTTNPVRQGYLNRKRDGKTARPETFL